MPMFDEYKHLIQQAEARVYEAARHTELDAAPQMSEMLGNHIYLKREDRQDVFSYKIRGAYNMMSSLSAEQKARGVLAASAGNHAQGVAMAAKKLGMAATIVMPKTTPEIKVNGVRRLGGRVVLHGNTYDDAFLHATKLCEEENSTYVPPYDHPLVIAGQATVAVELMQQLPDVERVFVPVGGGGLAAGMALHIKSVNPEVKIIAVEPDEAACLHAAMQSGERTVLDHIGIFADGAAVKQVGDENFRICRELVDDVLLVSVDEICAAVKDIFEDTRAIPEPAGALAVAGMKQYLEEQAVSDSKITAVVSGANVNFDRLRHIAELSALGEQKEALFCITIPEQAGSFRKLCHDLGPRPVTEFNYRYTDSSNAHVFAGIGLRHGIEEKASLLGSLREKGYEVVDMSNDELAKMHVRYMIGGKPRSLENERLYRFEFPERAGALLFFLNTMGDRFNISLFHYRNHGAAYGRVLLGVQVPPAEAGDFQDILVELGMQYQEEDENVAYRLFLG